jgi:hypothetical protein
MSDFKFQEKTDGEALLLIFEGVIDEESKFPAVDGNKHKRVMVDLKGIRSINSVGIREWLNWIRPLSETSQVVFLKTPKALVFQMNMVEGFLPKNGTVKSFYVPFYCEACDKEENVLFTVGQEVQVAGGNYTITYDVKKANLCGKADCEMEMDASEAKYFQFLKKMAS